ncbi:MAG TPA: hypothetical protein VIV06_00720 [Candidatus Limnocylindrales bacterium]
MTSEHRVDSHPDEATADQHGHEEAVLGPIDLESWAVGVLGVAIGLVIAACFALGSGYLSI